MQRELGLRGPVAAISAGSQCLRKAIQPDGGTTGGEGGQIHRTWNISRNIMNMGLRIVQMSWGWKIPIRIWQYLTRRFFCLNSIAGPRLCMLVCPVTMILRDIDPQWCRQSRFSLLKRHNSLYSLDVSTISMKSMFISLHSNPKEPKFGFPNVSHRHREGICEEVWKGQRGGQTNGLLDESRSCLVQWQLEHWFTVVAVFFFIS